MYFWRIDKLKAQLAARPLTDGESFPYLLISTALLSVSAGWADPLDSPEQIAYFIVGVIGTVAGTIYCYSRNGGASGEHFLQRYFAVGWVVGLRVLALLVPVSIVIYSLLDMAGLSKENGMHWAEVLYLGAIEIFLWWRVGIDIRHVANASSRNVVEGVEQ